VSAYYVHMEVDDRPGVLAQVAGMLGDAGASIKSVVQRGTGERAQLIMVTHPLLRSSVRAALASIATLPFVRSPPRAISVIDEEFE
jgi:homoserine dehydrogenase